MLIIKFKNSKGCSDIQIAGRKREFSLETFESSRLEKIEKMIKYHLEMLEELYVEKSNLMQKE